MRVNFKRGLLFFLLITAFALILSWLVGSLFSVLWKPMLIFTFVIASIGSILAMIDRTYN